MRNSLPFIFLLLFVFACSRLTEEEKLQRARDAMSSGKHDEAFQYYQMLYNEHPESEHRAEALYTKAAIVQNHRKDFTTAITLYRRLAEEYPDDERSAGAMFLVGFIYHNELHNLDSARVAYEEFIRRYPESEMIPSAQFELTNLGKDPAEIIGLGSKGDVTQQSPEK
jgi:TolA-binding protein